MFYDIVERKTLFMAIKSRSLKSRKIDIFPIGHFSTFCFLGTIGQQNMFYDILERKNAFLGYKNKFKKAQKLTFFQRG